MIPVLAGVLGLLVGSFLNVVIHRVPTGRSVVRPASHCPACGARVRARDNVPLFSYVLLRGRCRDCGAGISPRYPIVEATTGVLFGAAAYKFGVGLQLISALLLIAALVSLAGTDLEHRLLPNAIVGPAALAGFVVSALHDPFRWWVYLASAFLVVGGLLALAVLYPGGMGMGDVKMGGMLGVFLGPYAALAVFLGALAGAVAGGLFMVAGKMSRGTPLPFGVFMALGGLLALFLGPGLWAAYVDLLVGI